MRWQHLFDDLAAQQEAWERAEQATEIAEHTRAERGQVELADRLAAAAGGVVRVRVRGTGWLEGAVGDVGQNWVLLEGGAEVVTGREVLLALTAVVAVDGLTVRADRRPRRLDLRHALRGVSRDRARVRVHLDDGDHLSGTVDRVLADHLDLTRHADDEPRRAGAVRGVVSVPYHALAVIRRL